MSLHEHRWGAAGAPPAICVHGVGAHGRRFRLLAEERLAGRFRVRAVDLRGHGESTREPPWTIDAHTGDLLALVESPAVWIGHSFGGRLVAEIVARAPEVVARAVLLDPALWIPPDFAQALAEEELRERSFEDVDDWLAARRGDGGLSSLAHTPPEFLEEEAKDGLVRSPDGRYRYRHAREAVAAAFHEMAQPPPSFDALRVPTLLVVAAQSKLVSAGELENYRAALGDLLEVVVVPGGHIVLWDAFRETAEAIDAFLA